MYSLVEAVEQLLHRADGRQVEAAGQLLHCADGHQVNAVEQLVRRADGHQLRPLARTALVYGNGGVFSASAVALLRRVELMELLMRPRL